MIVSPIHEMRDESLLNQTVNILNHEWPRSQTIRYMPSPPLALEYCNRMPSPPLELEYCNRMPSHPLELEYCNRCSL